MTIAIFDHPGNVNYPTYWHARGYGLFAANPLGRYAIGDKTSGLQRNPDGSLDILIRHDAPGPAAQNNWLPAPAGRFALILRAYLPQSALRDGSYVPPPLEPQP